MPTDVVAPGITPGDLTPYPEDLARLVLIDARRFAPQIEFVEPGSELKKNTVAILKAVAARVAQVGTGAVASKGRNGTTISFRDVRAAFGADDIARLRSLFATPGAALPGLPRGSFPTDRPIEHVWPEGEYS